MNDDTGDGLMKLLDQLPIFLYISNDSRLPLIIFRSLMWTFKYGICAYSAPSFANDGLVLTGFLQDIQGGTARLCHLVIHSVEHDSTTNHVPSPYLVPVHVYARGLRYEEDSHPYGMRMILDCG